MSSSSSSSSSSSPPSAQGLSHLASQPLHSSPLASIPVVSEVPKPTISTPFITQGPPVIKTRPASSKSLFGQLPPTFKVEPTAPVSTKAPETTAFKFGLPGTPIFSQPQLITTAVKDHPLQAPLARPRRLLQYSCLHLFSRLRLCPHLQ